MWNWGLPQRYWIITGASVTTWEEKMILGQWTHLDNDEMLQKWIRAHTNLQTWKPSWNKVQIQNERCLQKYPQTFWCHINHVNVLGGISCQILIQDKCSTLDADKFISITLLICNKIDLKKTNIKIIHESRWNSTYLYSKIEIGDGSTNEYVSNKIELLAHQYRLTQVT